MASRSVLVTGASSGIGRATALRLDRLGWQVFAGVRKEADGDRLRAEASGRLQPVLVDVTHEAMVVAAAAAIHEAVGDGGLGGVVNNAGVGLGGPVEYLPLDEWRRQFEVNVIGQIAVTKAVLPMIRAATGRIVFMGSVSGRVAAAMIGPYSASKFAIEAIAETLRHELHRWGIKVIVVEPGAVKTPIWDKGRELVAEADKLFPPEAFATYPGHIEGVKKGIDRQERIGIPPDRVAAVVERALTSERPRARYLVGVDAKAGGLMSRLLPDSVRDRVMRLVTPS